MSHKSTAMKPILTGKRRTEPPAAAFGESGGERSREPVSRVFPAGVARPLRLADLTSGFLFGFAQVADFELEFQEAVIPFARERAGGERFEHRALFSFVWVQSRKWQRTDSASISGKACFEPSAGNPDVEFSHARRVNDHAALGEENHLAPRSGMPAFGVIRAHFHGGLDVFAIEPVDQARLADARGADEHGGVAGLDQFAPISSRLAR